MPRSLVVLVLLVLVSCSAAAGESPKGAAARFDQFVEALAVCDPGGRMQRHLTCVMREVQFIEQHMLIVPHMLVPFAGQVQLYVSQELASAARGLAVHFGQLQSIVVRAEAQRIARSRRPHGIHKIRSTKQASGALVPLEGAGSSIDARTC